MLKGFVTESSKVILLSQGGNFKELLGSLEAPSMSSPLHRCEKLG